MGIANLRVRDQLLEIGSQQLHLPIRKRSSFLIAVCHRRLNRRKQSDL